ncbi:MAG: D-alanine--D-alanine ligase [Bacteroidales bacterium]|jgi:D-alanine-D-alanine ligase|nr:D-alanine--D-alanine ligase [Bacteroidales bacterium]NPV37228.1 D-alanine--D-alanine ligase [Bacteroidales bacterium]
MKKLNIAVTGGGNSGEYDISVKSSQRVASLLDQRKYNVYLILIRGKEWVYQDAQGQVYPVNLNDFSLWLNQEIIHFDLVFNVIHGTPGEDGKLQGYFEMLGIRHTSCDSITSALTFNKSFCNKVVSSYGVKTAQSLHLNRPGVISPEEILKTLRLPFFVKPNCGGSSVGMSKVHTPEELLPALELAFKHDREVLIEEYIKGREITCGVYSRNGNPVALPLVEVVSKKEFFDFEAKYTENMADEILPAPISEELSQRCQETARMLYSKLNCKGVVRFDFILSDGEFWFLEVNTVPGMTSASIVPKMARHAGMELPDFYDLLIEEALKG